MFVIVVAVLFLIEIWYFWGLYSLLAGVGGIFLGLLITIKMEHELEKEKKDEI
jgi:hypothetical protein